MRVLFTAFPSAAHFFPMVPLAWALRTAGHDVVVTSQPALLPTMLSTGLPAVGAGEDVDLDAIWQGPDAAWRASEQSRAERGMLMFAAVAEAMAGDVLDFAARWKADAIVYEPRAYAGLVAAERLGLPLVRHLWGTDYTCDRWEIESPALAPLLERHGLTGASHLGTITLDVCPPALQMAMAPNRVLMRYVPFNGPGTIPALAGGARDRPRVCVTWGTTFSRQAGHLQPVHQAVAALDGLGVDIVVAIAASQARLLSDLPPRVTVLKSVPLQLSLPFCDAIIHQGGAGTTITSAVLGLPQLVVPSFGDEPANAAQVAASGAGRLLPLADSSVEALRAEAGALLGNPGYRDTAATIRREVMALPSPAARVATVTALERRISTV